MQIYCAYSTLSNSRKEISCQAIFADDTDDENEETEPSQTSAQAGPSAGDAMKRAEAANAALNRLVAGDFLESLGKELGLKVPEPARPAGDKPATKEIDGGGLGRSKKDVELKGNLH
jgi:G patch domain-containing protein 1